ncbi:MAG: Type II secretion system protein G precursor [Candidatus Hinthialibacteria bacterium OLB16]|nr:MAG: Type II secretion system protein G precursor [Candidatus Hinthialibacteria bacterium OLB16]
MFQSLPFSRSRKRAFTLIELLIVIAIILILISIALPNFMEAQIRAKVTKVKGEFRSIETAMFAYRQINPHYPFTEPTGKAPFIRRAYWPSGPRIRFAYELTTPVKYLQSVNFIDPFIGSGAVSDQHKDYEWSYYYLQYETFAYHRPSDKNYFDAWCLCSWALDTYDSGCSWFPQIVVNAKKKGVHFDPGSLVVFYSPTNGTRSRGDIAKYGGWVPPEVKMFDK